MGHHHKKKYSLGSFLKDAGKITKPLNKDFIHVIDSSTGVLNNVVNKSAGTLSSLSIPLMIGGLIVGYYLITKK